MDAILQRSAKLAAKEKLALVEDHGLVDENAGLAEWPVVLSGSFDQSFLDVPQEVLITSMKAHQKCFSLRETSSGKLANRFLMVANLAAADGGNAIIAGNERVIRARLSDAKFFWTNDKARGLDAMLPKLDAITFHEKLGTQGDRVQRLMMLARELALLVGADPDKAERAAQLCKADLVSETVGEFPELQGIVGRYLALEHGEDAQVADAIAEHYKPTGQGDNVPENPVSTAVALADRLDMLVGFWRIDEKPTGSKDPYALRRAGLGIIRIVLEHQLRVALVAVAANSRAKHIQLERKALSIGVPGRLTSRSQDLLSFFADRLKVHLRDKGARHDLIDAIFALPGQDDLLMIVRRVEALGRFLGNR